MALKIHVISVSGAEDEPIITTVNVTKIIEYRSNIVAL